MRQESPISNIDLYQIFRKVPNVSEDEAKQVADTVARIDQVATKADLIALEAKMLRLAIWTVAFNVTFTVTLTVGLIKLL